VLPQFDISRPLAVTLAVLKSHGESGLAADVLALWESAGEIVSKKTVAAPGPLTQRSVLQALQVALAKEAYLDGEARKALVKWLHRLMKLVNEHASTTRRLSTCHDNNVKVMLAKNLLSVEARLRKHLRASGHPDDSVRMAVGEDESALAALLDDFTYQVAV
jgi:hypothetical protein